MVAAGFLSSYEAMLLACVSGLLGMINPEDVTAAF